MTSGSGRGVFVTVGTTSFDKLIHTTTRAEIIEVLRCKGYNGMTLQIGRGNFEPEESTHDGFGLMHFRYKDSILEDFKEADLVISHAGSGSVLEALGLGKPLIVVINEDLMNNHQLEVAQQLAKDGHLFYTTCSGLKDTLETMDLTTLKPFEQGQPEKFVSFLDTVMGFS